MLLHLLLEMVQPMRLSAESDQGEGTHLEVTSVLWQILNAASLRTAFELSVG